MLQMAYIKDALRRIEKDIQTKFDSLDIQHVQIYNMMRDIKETFTSLPTSPEKTAMLERMAKMREAKAAKK